MGKIISFFKSKIFFINIILFLVLSLTIAKLTTIFLDYYTLHNQKIEVPDVKNLSVLESEKIFKKNKMGLVVIDTIPYNPKFPKESIVRQIPEAGSFVKKGRNILVVINSSSYKKVTIPDVLYLTKRQAISKLIIAGFRIGEEYYADYYGKDIVLALKHNGITLTSSAKIPINSKIDIVVGNGVQSR